jgi:hypothetical protein
MLENPKFLQGLFSFGGSGLESPVPLQPAVSYRVPFDRRAQLVYFRAGNPSGELVYAVLERNGRPMRYFPIGAKAAVHVELAVVEDLEPETELTVRIGAPNGLQSSVLLDVGLVEI